MSMKLNWLAWVQLLKGDLDWLRAQPRTLERDHVIQIIERLSKGELPGARAFYDAQPAPRI